MKLRFDDWMNRCLYDPKRGYYSRNVKTVGKGGDFTTTPELINSLGHAIAGWIQEEWRHHGEKLPVIELGAGSGVLTKQVRESLSWKHKIGLTQAIVEVSTNLRAQQEQLLGKKVQWFPSAQEAISDLGGHALIYSNEFVDAFPVRIFKKEGGGWLELFLIIQDGETHETWEEATSLPFSSIFTQDWEEGQRVEVHASYHNYLEKAIPSLKKGSLLTIDYGDLAADLYERKKRGSIRSYFIQERYEDAQIYQNMGRQDLTADVNFSDLMNWGKTFGLETAFIRTQSEFLENVDVSSRLVDQFGAGSAFKVLLQRKKHH